MRALVLGSLLAPGVLRAEAEPEQAAGEDAARRPAALDVRDAETGLKLQRGDFVAVPIPISDPTLGSGLVAGAAYFYPQTAAQKKAQPASVTAVAGLYTSTDSYAYGIGQQNYWAEDRWRFSGAIAHAELELELLAPTKAGEADRPDWLIDGNFVFSELSRAIWENWYAGLSARYVDIDQSFEPSLVGDTFDVGNEVRSVGLGLSLTFDSRDLPINSYRGRLVELRTLFNDQSLGSDKTYQSYSAAFRSYHSALDDLVLAWEVEGCRKHGRTPLWDACLLGLRGFPATEYMARASGSVQFEARWRFRPRWGVVGFGAFGAVDDALAESQEDELVTSLGIGLRYMILPSKRVNLRLDYARAEGGEAIYFSVGEAF